MKTYKTIQEWLASKPAKEEVEKILGSINAKEISKARRNLFFMNLELGRIQRYKKTTEKMGFSLPQEMVQKEKSLKQEIQILSKELPPAKPKTAKAKEEPKEESIAEEANEEAKVE